LSCGENISLGALKEGKEQAKNVAQINFFDCLTLTNGIVKFVLSMLEAMSEIGFKFIASEKSLL
jgi:hypothetical protein